MPTNLNPERHPWVVGGIVIHDEKEENTALNEIFKAIPYPDAPDAQATEDRGVQQSLPVVDEDPDLRPSHRWQGLAKRAGQVALTAVRNSVIVAETTFPLNELITYGPPVAVGLVTKDPVATGLAAGGSTFALELLGARFGAKLLGAKQPETTDSDDGATIEPLETSVRERGRVERIIDGILDSKLLSMIVPPRGKKVSPVALGLVTLYGGTIAGQKLKEREDSTRTEQELWRYGSRAAGVLGALCTAEAMLGETGIANLDRPYISGPIVAATTAAWLGLRRVRQRIARRNEREESGVMPIPSLVGPTQREPYTAEPNYKLTAEELGVLESELVELVKGKSSEEGVVGVWIQPDSKFANFIRVHEAGFFDEVEEVSEEGERHTLFLALVDTRPSVNRIVHGGSVTGVSYEGEDGRLLMDGPELTDATSGFYTVDELAKLGNFSHQEFYDYYADRGIDLKKSIAVETNMAMRRHGQKMERFLGLKPVDIAYLMYFKLVQRRAREQLDNAAVFASVNQLSINSFENFGISYEPLMGRSDMKTPESLRGRFSLPIAILHDAKNREIFNSIDLPEFLI